MAEVATGVTTMGPATGPAEEQVTAMQRALETEAANQIEAATEAMQTINDPHHPETANR